MADGRWRRIRSPDLVSKLFGKTRFVDGEPVTDPAQGGRALPDQVTIGDTSQLFANVGREFEQYVRSGSLDSLWVFFGFSLEFLKNETLAVHVEWDSGQ